MDKINYINTEWNWYLAIQKAREMTSLNFALGRMLGLFWGRYHD